MPNYDGIAVGAEKTAVVFDIGCAYTKCGFAGENGPRFIIPSEVCHSKSGKIHRIYSLVNDKDSTTLYEILIDFVHSLYFRHLLVNPKDRRVVIVESVLSTSKFRNTITEVLFKQFEVLSVAFATSHVVALLTLGIPSGLVFDCGYLDTLVLPVYEGIAMMSCCQVVPTASKAIHQCIDAELRATATVKIGKNSTVPMSSINESLKESVLEDIKVRTCFVTSLSRSKLLHFTSTGSTAAESTDTLETATPLTPPPGLEYPIDGSRLLRIDGSLREKVSEVLFERNAEEMAIPMLILNSLLKCPIDTRRTLAENIVILGGTTMLPGFRTRLMAELNELVLSSKYCNSLGVRSFKFHSPPAKENYAAWLGGAIFGALEVLSQRSLSREQFVQGVPIPDWCLLYDPDNADIEKNIGS